MSYLKVTNIKKTISDNYILKGINFELDKGKVLVAAASPEMMEGYINENDLIIMGNRYGMQTMDGTLLGLYKQGKILKEDVLAYCFDPEIMEKMLID